MLFFSLGASHVYSTVTSTDTSNIIRSTASLNVDIYADEISYNHLTNMIDGIGNVKIYYKDMELCSDRIEYGMAGKFVIAYGSISFRKEGYSLTSNKLLYFLDSSTGVVYGAAIKAPHICICKGSYY